METKHPLVYSSETGMWSKPIYAQGYHAHFVKGNSVLLGSALYFKTYAGVLKYDLLAHEMSPVHLPAEGARVNTVLMATEDGMLGFANADKSRLYLWSREHGPDDGARWAQYKVIKLDTLIPVGALGIRPRVACFSKNGDGSVILIRTDNRAGFYSIDLKSGRSKKVVGQSYSFRIGTLSFLT